MDTKLDRLRLFQNHIGLSNNAFAAKCGINPSNYAKMLKGNLSFTQRSIALIGDAFPQLNTMWLLSGDGEMLRNNPAQDNANNQVPLIPASAFAGSVNGIAAELVTLDKCEFINAPVGGAELAIQITGDSMEPEYPNGAYAYIRKINEHAFIPWGHTVILDTENGAFIKKIYPDEDNDEYIWAKSINPNYPPMHVPKSCVLNIFRVLAVSRIFTTM